MDHFILPVHHRDSTEIFAYLKSVYSGETEAAPTLWVGSINICMLNTATVWQHATFSVSEQMFAVLKMTNFHIHHTHFYYFIAKIFLYLMVNELKSAVLPPACICTAFLWLILVASLNNLTLMLVLRNAHLAHCAVLFSGTGDSAASVKSRQTARHTRDVTDSTPALHLPPPPTLPSPTTVTQTHSQMHQ